MCYTMKNRTRLVLSLALTLVLMYSVIASAQTNIKVWSFNVNTAAIEVIQSEIISEFEAQNPGVKVSWQHVPYDGYREKLLTAAVAGDLPDVFVDGSNMVGMYQSRGVILPIDDYIAGWDVWEDIMETPRRQATYLGSVYGVPTRIKPNPPIYNVEAIAKAGLDPNNLPTNWDELLELGRQLTQVENGRVVFQGIAGVSSPSTRIRTFDLMLQQNGGRMLTEDLSAPAFNSPEGLYTLQKFIELYNISEPQGVAPLTEGLVSNYAAGLVGTVPFDAFGTINNALVNNNLEILEKSVVTPALSSGTETGRQLVMLDGDMAMLSARSANPDLAFEFIKFFFEPENHMKYAEANAIIPLLMSQIDSDYVKNAPFFEELMSMDEYGWDLVSTPEYPEVRNALLDEIDKAIFGRQTPEEALNRAEQIWIRAIREYR